MIFHLFDAFCHQHRIIKYILITTTCVKSNEKKNHDLGSEFE